MNKFPKFSQCKQIIKILTKKEKITILILFLFVFFSGSFLSINFYLKNTKISPTQGGVFIEGVIGQPRFINPIYGEINDIDRSLIDIVFSGLMSYDKNGQIINDLAESYKISEDGKIYEFILKDNIFWHDGKKLTSDDIIFTIKTIQNSDYKSPLRVSWIDVDIEKTSDRSLNFILKNSYNSFLENCTLKIIPKHIWENILPENFALSSYNLKPIGSGPYKFESIDQKDNGLIEKINFSSNNRYYNKTPYITEFSFYFFNNEEGLLKAIKQKTINGFSESLLNKDGEREKQNLRNFSENIFEMPRYFAIFLNTQKQRFFSDINLRKSINLSTDKEEIIKLLGFTENTAKEVNSPILPEFFNLNQSKNIYKNNIEESKNFLEKSGFKELEDGRVVKEIKKTPAFQFKNYLYSKSKGTEVTELQKCLAKLGFTDDLKDEINGTYGKPTENAVTNFQMKYLPEEKPTGEVGKATRSKLNEVCVSGQETFQYLKFTLLTINQPQLLKIANLLKDQWQKVGFEIEIKSVESQELKILIKNRDYDALLYGQSLSFLLDLYPFWHSSQINDPGLNLSEYQNKEVDSLLKSSREDLLEDKKNNYIEKIQDLIIQEAPAVFLYNPGYVYFTSNNVFGINNGKIVDPSKRFSDVSNWYIKTKRVWK